MKRGYIMGEFFQKAALKYQQFMYGRYGQDPLGFALLITSIILNYLSPLFGYGIAYILALVLLGLYAFRFLSRDIDKRSLENQKFLAVLSPFKKAFLRKRRQARDTEHKYFNCPSCKKTLRVPKGRGKIKIDCPHCGKHFTKRT